MSQIKVIWDGGSTFDYWLKFMWVLSLFIKWYIWDHIILWDLYKFYPIIKNVKCVKRMC